MADYRARTDVNAPAGSLFAYLSDVSNLPKYFDRMTSAVPRGGEAVEATAVLPDGREEKGEAWFRVDDAAQTLAWGSEGPNDYHGRLEVTATGDASVVEVTLSTERVESDEIQHGLDHSVQTIKRLVEGG